MHRRTLFVSCCLLALAAACNKSPSSTSGSSTGASAGSKPVSALLEDADAAKQAGDWKKALSIVDTALADPKATSEEKVFVWQDKVFCEAHVNGEEAVKTSLRKMAEANVAMAPKDYAKLGGDLAGAGKLDEALAVLASATEKFKGDAEAHKQLEKFAKLLARKFAETGDASGQDKLNSLGYIGGSEDE